MRKNNKGFTLIELLAVITIMGILMLVGIPAIGRTIENVRRDSFADITAKYVDAVRNAINADDLMCKKEGSSSFDTVASALPEGYYYVTINSDTQATKDLMEKGGRSPYGSAHMYGYVKFVKTWDASTGKSKTEYFVRMQDSGRHGLKVTESGTDRYELKENELKRSSVVSDTTKESLVSGSVNTEITVPSDGTNTYYECQVS